MIVFYVLAAVLATPAALIAALRAWNEGARVMRRRGARRMAAAVSVVTALALAGCDSGADAHLQGTVGGGGNGGGTTAAACPAYCVANGGTCEATADGGVQCVNEMLGCQIDCALVGKACAMDMNGAYVCVSKDGGS